MSVGLEVLASYLPRAVLDALDSWDSVEPTGRRGEGTALVADISGFSALTERLATDALGGAEAVGRLLNAYFGCLVERVLSYGGDVVSFPGDALLAIWSTEHMSPDVALRSAAACALSIQRDPVGVRDPTLAKASIALRVGLGFGSCEVGLVGGVRDRWQPLVIGGALAQAAAAQRAGRPGGVVISQEFAARLSGARLTPLAGGGATLEALLDPPEPAPPTAREQRATLAGRLRSFLPGAIRSRLSAGPSGWLAELRTITALFVRLPDLAVAEPLDLRQLQAIATTVQRVLYRFEGALDKFSVDEKGVALLCAFGLPPLSHEDDPLRGGRAALAIFEALEALGVRATVGVATGRVFCGTLGSILRREYTILGYAVNLAARLMVAADGQGGVLCDAATRDAIGGRLSFSPRPPVNAKGFSAPVQVFRPNGELQSGLHSRVEGRAAPPLIGRKDELRTVVSCLEQVAGGGRGVVLLVDGPAGIGKSRLLEAAVAEAAGHGMRVLVGAGDVIEQLTPFHAAPIFSEILGLHRPEARQEGVGRVEAALARDPELATLAPLAGVAAPLGLAESEYTAALGPAARADRTQAVLLRLLVGWAESGPPGVIVMDDVQWLDSASWSLLQSLPAALDGMLLLLAGRPTESASSAQARLAALSGVTRITLQPLSEEAGVALAEAALGLPDVPRGLLRLLVARAEGNPFYVGELARAVRETGDIEAARAGLWKDSMEVTSLPTSVEGAITSRLDRLSPEVGLVLKVGSVFGRSFTLSDLEAIWPLADTPADLGRWVQFLEDDGYLRRSVDPDGVARWNFAQSLLRDAAYGLMTHAQRRSLHEEVARRMEEFEARGVALDLPVLAFHWTRAEQTTQAVAALDRAGEEAARQYALAEMNRLFNKALELAPDAPAPQRFRWLLHIGVSRLRAGLPTESRRSLLAALSQIGRAVPHQPLRRAVGIASELLYRLLRGWGLLKPRRREAVVDEARAWLELGWAEYFRLESPDFFYAQLRALRAAEQGPPGYALAVGYASLTVITTFAGLKRNAIAYAQRCRAVLGEVKDPAAHGTARELLGLCATALADWGPALEHLSAAEDFQGRAGLHEDLDLSELIRAQIAWLRGDLSEARSLSLSAASRGERRGSLIVGIRGRFSAGLILLAAGRLSAAVEGLQRAASIAAEEDRELDAASAIMALAGRALARLYAGDVTGAANAAALVARHPKRAAAAASPASRLGDALALLFTALDERGGDGGAGWREQAWRQVQELKRRSRMMPVHGPTAARWEGRLLWREGREDEAIAAWRRGREEADRLGMAWESAMISAELGRKEPAETQKAAAALGGQGANAAALLAAYGVPARLSPPGALPRRGR